jgi:hypothetical protein
MSRRRPDVSTATKERASREARNVRTYSRKAAEA